jgi:hypothetical protein
MRATKGLWAAVGAGTSLAAAGILALFAVSVVLAVRGWPQVRSAGSGDAVLRAEVASAPAGGAAAYSDPPMQIVVERERPARRQVASGRKPERRRSASPGRVPSPTSSSQRQPSTQSPVSSGPSAATPSSGFAPQAQVPQVTHVADDTVKNVTAGVGEAVRPISPPVADTVTKTGEQAGDVIEQVGNTVGGLVGGLTGNNQP